MLRLARLGVDQTAQSAGVGSQLLRFVLKLAQRQMNELGNLGVLIDAKPESISFYERYGFVALAPDAIVEGSVSGDPVAMFLSIDSIP